MIWIDIVTGYGTAQTGMESPAIPGTAQTGLRDQLLDRIIIVREYGTALFGTRMFVGHGTAQIGSPVTTNVTGIIQMAGTARHGMEVYATSGKV
jgi:hypothetical protein